MYACMCAVVDDILQPSLLLNQAFIVLGDEKIDIQGMKAP